MRQWRYGDKLSSGIHDVTFSPQLTKRRRARNIHYTMLLLLISPLTRDILYIDAHVNVCAEDIYFPPLHSRQFIPWKTGGIPYLPPGKIPGTTAAIAPGGSLHLSLPIRFSVRGMGCSLGIIPWSPCIFLC